MTIATYCTQRHMRTGDSKYLDWAQQIVAYNWLATIPVQFPGLPQAGRAPNAITGTERTMLKSQSSEYSK